LAQAIVKNLIKKFGDVVAVNDVSFTAESKKFVTLLGPSGCGKTTTLRCIAGIEEPDEGEIVIGGDVVFSSKSGIFVPPEKRGIGMVFQSYALWPHLTVFDNVAYPLKVRKLPKDEIRKNVKESLEMVHLSGLEDRMAPNLSGGQQQRVALARALVYNPKLVLFDEPLSNLDAPLREEMRSELKELQRKVGITAIYVTHDRAEALSLSDQLVVMGSDGIRAIGTPSELLEKPPNSYVAMLLAGMSVVDGTVVQVSDDRRIVFEAPFGKVYCKPMIDVKEGDRMKLCLRIDELNLLKTRNNSTNVFDATVGGITHGGYFVEYRILLDNQVVVKVMKESSGATPAAMGDRIFLEIPESACVLVKS
jgi:iron(III) transport system ATP-binding protein